VARGSTGTRPVPEHEWTQKLGSRNKRTGRLGTVRDWRIRAPICSREFRVLFETGGIVPEGFTTVASIVMLVLSIGLLLMITFIVRRCESQAASRDTTATETVTR